MLSKQKTHRKGMRIATYTRHLSATDSAGIKRMCEGR